MGTIQKIWGERTLEEDRMEFVSIGNLRLWMLFKDADLWIGYQYVPDEQVADNQNPPEDLDWSRWAMKGDIKKIRLMPVFPDKPLVVKSEYPLKISSGANIQVFARVPIWIRISVAHKQYQLVDLPIIKLSRTWFGSEQEGELCYHATTKARRSLSKVDPKPYLVNCPIHITNKSQEDLNFERFCYRVERLKIFESDNQLWADETKIIYHGENLNSDIIMTGKLPEGIKEEQLITKPRKQVHKSLATRTFHRLF